MSAVHEDRALDADFSRLDRNRSPLPQSQAFEAVARAAPRHDDFASPFVLVTGGKGGVGKTTVAINLALELARRGRRPLLVDLDLALANVHVLLRLETKRTLEDAFAGRCSLAGCVLRGPGGVDVLPASSGQALMADLGAPAREWLLRELARLAVDYDCVIADSAAGIGPDVLAFASAADRVLVITAPDPAALTDAYGLIKALDELARTAGGDLATPELVVNFADGIDQATTIAKKLRAVCERFLSRAPELAGWLPRASSIARAALTQRPFALGAGGLERACLARLAHRVERTLASAHRTPATAHRALACAERAPAPAAPSPASADEHEPPIAEQASPLGLGRTPLRADRGTGDFELGSANAAGALAARAALKGS